MFAHIFRPLHSNTIFTYQLLGCHDLKYAKYSKIRYGSTAVEHAMTKYRRYADNTHRCGAHMRMEFVANFIMLKDLNVKLASISKKFVDELFEKKVICLADNDARELQSLTNELGNAQQNLTKPPTKSLLSRVDYAERKLLFHLFGKSFDEIIGRLTNERDTYLLETVTIDDLHHDIIPYNYIGKFLVDFYNNYLPEHRWYIPADGNPDPIFSWKIHYLFDMYAFYSISNLGVFDNETTLPLSVKECRKYFTKQNLDNNGFQYKLGFPVSAHEVTKAILEPINRFTEIILHNCFSYTELNMPTLNVAIIKYITEKHVNIFPFSLSLKYKDGNDLNEWSEVK